MHTVGPPDDRSGRLFVGTSGFAYKEWIGPFYPEGTTSAGMLPHYASRLGAVEVNYTFRQHPAVTTLTKWVHQTPESFLFAPKANQSITHYGRLRDAGERLNRFFTAMAPFGNRLGPVLFQCPSNLAYDPEILDGFLGDLATEPLARGVRAVMELPHPSFDSAEARAQLSAAGVAACVVDPDGGAPLPKRLDRSAGFVYLRLRRAAYPWRALDQWAGLIREALAARADVYAFFKHEDAGLAPRRAAYLKKRCDAPKAPTSRPVRPRQP